MGVLLIFFTFSLGIIVSYVLFQYNSGKNTSSIHPSLLKLRELEQSSLNKDNSKKSKKSSVPEFDLNGELFPLYHNEEEYPILTNDIRKERTKEITNIMIQTVKDVTADNAWLTYVGYKNPYFPPFYLKSDFCYFLLSTMTFPSFYASGVIIIIKPQRNI